MSFLNPTPIPVTLYSSDDTEAPQLSSTNWTGAIKTILKACLVTGYGGKQGAGWAMTDETDHQATFTPTDPKRRRSESPWTAATNCTASLTLFGKVWHRGLPRKTQDG